jgi:hypothetical protein
MGFYHEEEWRIIKFGTPSKAIKAKIDRNRCLGQQKLTGQFRCIRVP